MCVQAIHAPNGDVHVTNTHDPDSATVIFEAGEWAEFLATVRAGEHMEAESTEGNR